MEVVKPMMLERYVRSSGGRARRFDPGNFRELGNIGGITRQVAPMFSAVRSDLQIAIVGARPDHSSLRGRLGDSDYRAMIFRGRVLGPHRADALLLFRIVGGEVRADGRPRLPEICGF